MAMHHFYLRMPSSVSHLDEDFRRMLGDTDPGVMEGALVLFHQLVKVGWGRGGAGGRRAVWKGWQCVWSAPLISATGICWFTSCSVYCCHVVKCLYKDAVEIHVYPWVPPLPSPPSLRTSPPSTSRWCPPLSTSSSQPSAAGCPRRWSTMVSLPHGLRSGCLRYWPCLEQTTQGRRGGLSQTDNSNKHG